MSEDPFENDLKTQFSDEDALLDSTEFIEAIDRHLDRQRHFRRFLLTGCGLLGGALALFQLPRLLGEISPSTSNVTGYIIEPLRQTADSLTSDPWMLGMAAACGLTLLLLASFERA